MSEIPELEIRTALSTDVDPIRTVYRRASLWNEGDRDALLANPDALEFDPEPVAAGRTRVAVAGGQVVGFATTRASGADTLELDDLFVDPDRMRQGIATALIRDAEQAARAAGVACVEVVANGHALAFYRAVGFTVTGTVETRFGPGTRMRLDIEPAGGA
jgi:ribosomal protein S18 acetylase RimI-like enzyme